MTETYVSYEPGSWTLLARGGRYLLVRAQPSDEPISRLWTTLESAPAEQLLASVANDLPGAGFCYVEVGQDGVRIAQSGISAALDGRPVDAGTTPTALSVPATGGMVIAATEAGSRGLQIPIEGGVVGAGALVVVQVPSEAEVGATAEPVEAGAEAAILPVAGEAEAVEEIPSTTQIWDDVPQLDDTVLDGPPVEVAAPVALADSPLGSVEPALPEVPPLPAVPVLAEPPASVFAPPPPPAEPETAPAEDRVPAEIAAPLDDWGLTAPPEPEPDPEPEPEPEPGPLSLSDAPPPQVQAPGAASQDPSTYAGETVLAGICLQGHLSPAHGPSCRVCGAPMPAQTPRTIPRPSLGSLVLPSGETFELDRGAVLGRAPRIPDDASEPVHLVNLAPFGRDVSRQHAEVIVHGWNVYVRDLGSANGTRVHGPTGQVTVLEPGAPVILPPGSSIEVAEITTIQYRTA